MLDYVLAAISLILLAVFLGIVVFFVKEPDLTIVCVVGVLLCAFDFWRTLRQSGNETSGDGQ